MATESAERVGGPNVGDTVDLLADYAPNPIYWSSPVRVDQWYNSSSHQSTISIISSNFIGTMSLEASIKANPGTYDWFNISLDGVNPFLTFPDYFLGAFGGSIRGETSNRAYNFSGRFTWFRVKIDTTITDGIPYGFIDRILVNL